MTFTQQTFLGSSIRNFTTSLGWGGEISKCTINLADDISNGDLFSPPAVGTPAFFTYDDFVFGGLIQSYKTLNDQGGFPVYEIILIDPRELLDGVQLILNNYNADTTTIPNLYNIYGYWENANFGSSLINDGGMPWRKVIDGFTTLVAITPMKHSTSLYQIDLSALTADILPSYYRIGSSFTTSLMEIITQICNDAGLDFFFKLIANINNVYYITLYTVSRLAPPIFGSISNFINQNTSGQAISSEFGLEMRNETTSKFVIGGNIARIYLQTPTNADEDSYIDDTIMQYWGTNENGTPIIGTPTTIDNPLPPSSGEYSFNIPSRFVNVFGVEDTYPTTVNEMRAALGGQSGWETFLWSKNNIVGGIHENKANRIGLLSNIRTDLVDVLKKDFTDEAKFRSLDLRLLAPLNGKLLNQQGDWIKSKEENVKILYDYISTFANEHYGKKFMVRIPFTYATIETDTNVIRTSQEPCDGGYLTENEKTVAIDQGYLPPQLFNLTSEDSRITTYCKFNNAQSLDLSDIPPDNISMDFKQNNDEESLIAYIKCEVDKKIYYLDNTTLFSPRVVVTLPGRIVPKLIEEGGNDFAGILRNILTDHAKSISIPNSNINSIINDIFNRFGGEQLLYGMAGAAKVPDLIGIPLQSNIETYGPWYALGAIGKIETIQEPTLVPWNYNGYEVMNLVGDAMVQDGVTYQQAGETGSIEVPGSPTLGLGSQLLDGGPYITNISVSIGENGVTTRYNMETWTPRFGKMSKTNIDRINRINGTLQTQKRLIQQLNQAPPTGSKLFNVRANALLNKTSRRDPHTSATFLAGEVFTNASGNKTANVVVSPTYDLPLTINSGNYPSKAFVSLDGLFRPFSTSPNATGISHFETPTSSGNSGRSVFELNPYQNGTDINNFARGNTLPTDNQFLSDLANDNVRAVAFRGPIILSGWGYDSAGKPVPNSNPTTPTDNFLDGYLQKSDQWKTGPVDLVWNNTRKVWTGGVGAFRVAKLTQNLRGGSWASGILLTPNISGISPYNLFNWTEESGGIRIYDGFEYSYPSTPSGARVYVQKEQTSSEWFVFAAGVI